MAKVLKWTCVMTASTDQEYTDNKSKADTIIISSDYLITKTVDDVNRRVTLTYEDMTV